MSRGHASQSSLVSVESWKFQKSETSIYVAVHFNCVSAKKEVDLGVVKVGQVFDGVRLSRR